MRAAPDAAIVAEDLSRSYGPVVAVDRITLSVARAEVFGLIGPDGAGKTTLLRMLAGILDPSAGRAVVTGADVRAQPELLRRQIGYMPQAFSLYRDLTVRENLHFFAEIYQVPRAEVASRTERLLAFSRLGPYERTLADHLSGGMRQKLALACTLIHEPHLLLLDEPTTGVDPVSRREFWNILYDLNRRGATVLVATPYMDEAERCTRIGFMYGGRLLSVAPPARIKAQLEGEILEIVAEPRRRALAVARGLEVVRTGSLFGDTLHLTVPDAAAAEPQVRAALDRVGIPVRSLRVAPASLEDVFISLMTQAERPDVA